MQETFAIQTQENGRGTVRPSNDRVCKGQCPECESGGFERGAVWCEFVCDECGLVVEEREMEYISDACSASTRVEPTPRMTECGERVEG